MVSWEPPHRSDASYQGTTLAGPYRLIKNPGFTPFCLFLFADNLNELDFTLLKTFSLGESRRLEFRGEFFNLANHPTFAAPSTSISSGSGAQVSATLNSSRQVQLGAKFMF